LPFQLVRAVDKLERNQRRLWRLRIASAAKLLHTHALVNLPCNNGAPFSAWSKPLPHRCKLHGYRRTFVAWHLQLQCGASFAQAWWLRWMLHLHGTAAPGLHRQGHRRERSKHTADFHVAMLPQALGSARTG
jgi:hypothetical protein